MQTGAGASRSGDREGTVAGGRERGRSRHGEREREGGREGGREGEREGYRDTPLGDVRPELAAVGATLRCQRNASLVLQPRESHAASVQGGVRMVHLGRSTCHAISGRGD